MTDYPTGAGQGAPMAERMQQLLSRAVEDQLSEQRQLAGVLADIRMALARIPEEIRGGAGAAIADQVSALQQLLDGLGARLDLMSTRLAELATTDGLRGAVDRLEVLLSRVDAVNARLDGLGGRFDALGDPSAEVRTRVAPVEARIAAAERRIAELSQTVVDSERRLAEHVDEAVLALADALLRRRTRPGGPQGGAAGARAAAAAEPAAPAEPAEPADRAASPAPAEPADQAASPAPAEPAEEEAWPGGPPAEAEAQPEVEYTLPEEQYPPAGGDQQAVVGAATQPVPVAAERYRREGEPLGEMTETLQAVSFTGEGDFEELDLDEEVPLAGIEPADAGLAPEGPGPVPNGSGGWADLDDEEQQRRRRPWWRPGE